MYNQWIDKYKPQKMKDIIANKEEIDLIIKWLKNYRDKYNTLQNSPSSIIVLGDCGIGKSTIIDIIVKHCGYRSKKMSIGDVKNKKVIEEIKSSIMQNKNVRNMMQGIRDTRTVLVIDDVDKITLTTEISGLVELFKQNQLKRMFPIIFISNIKMGKLPNKIVKLNNSTKKIASAEICFKLSNPSYQEFLKLLNHIVESEKLSITQEGVKKKIIEYSQYDLRKLIHILHDLYYTFKHQNITENDVDLYFSHTQQKKKDISLDDAVQETIREYHSLKSCLMLFEREKVLLPLGTFENFYKSMFHHKYPDSTNLEIMRRAGRNISLGDVIETNIYTDQNWYLQKIHGFYTCASTSYYLNKYPHEKNQPINYKIDFSSDLSKNSLKNINKKNVQSIKLAIPNKNIEDILFMNLLIMEMLKNQDYLLISKIIKYYNLDIKQIETILKIDKTIPAKNRLDIKSKTRKQIKKIVEGLESNNYQSVSAQLKEISMHT